MKFVLKNGATKLNDQGTDILYKVSLSVQTTDPDLYSRLMEAIKGAVPEPKEVEPKQGALGFQMEEESGEES